MIFHVISDSFLECFFKVLCRFWIPSGIVFETFRWFSALAETVAPFARELCFSVFQAVRNTVFSCIAFQGALGDYILNFLAYFGLRWATHRRYFGHQWALI